MRRYTVNARRINNTGATGGFQKATTTGSRIGLYKQEAVNRATRPATRKSRFIILTIENELESKRIIKVRMLFPIRCVSCNAVIAGKYEAYLARVAEYRKQTGQTEMEYLSNTTVKTAEGKALDDLGVKRMCCRRHFLSFVELT